MHFLSAEVFTISFGLQLRILSYVSYCIFAHWFSLNQMFKFSVSFATEVEKNRPSHGQRFNRGLRSTKDLKRATGHLSSPTNNVHDLKSPLLSWKTCILVHLNALARKTYLLLCSGFWNVFF